MQDDMTDGTRRSILIVDDDEVLRNRLGRAFAERGYDARVAGSFREAADMAQQDSPEWAVVDLRMPDHSGLELVQELRRLDPATRVLVLTGYGSIATAVDAMRLGASSYLPKPADVDDIVTAFERSEKPVLDVGHIEHSVPSLARAEWEHINRVLRDCNSNVSMAARSLGLHRRSLQRKLQKYPPHV